MSGEAKLHLERYAADARQLVARAQSLADGSGHKHLTTSHLLSVLLGTYEEAWREQGANVAALARTCASELHRATASAEPSYLDARMISLLSRAELIAVSDGVVVGAEQLIRALLEIRPDLKRTARVELSAATQEAKPTPAPPRSESVYLYEGRRILRRAAEARDLIDDDAMQSARARRLLDAVTHELTEGAAVLTLDRESVDELQISREGRAAELRIEWRARSHTMMMSSRERLGDPTHLARYAWVTAEGRWGRTDAAGDFFEDLAAKLEGSFYAPETGPA